MKLISYTGTRSGFAGLGSILVRVRLKSAYSHTEVMFEPGDGVEHLVPDGNLEPTEEGYWCASSVASDTLPDWSVRRKGKIGGVRFKRIQVDSGKWNIQDCQFDPVRAADWFHRHEGECYDWKHIFSFIGIIPNLIFSQSFTKWTCAEACGAAFGFGSPDIFDPHNLPVVTDRCNEIFSEVQEST